MKTCSLMYGMACFCWCYVVNTLRPRQNGCHFPDDIFKWIFLNENVWISIKISLKFVPKGPIDNIPALVQIMAWRRPGDKPLSEPIMVRLPTHICVTRPQWVHTSNYSAIVSKSSTLWSCKWYDFRMCFQKIFHTKYYTFPNCNINLTWSKVVKLFCD